MPKLLINVVSIMQLHPHFGKFPECIFMPIIEQMTKASKIGYDGFQALPIRGLTGCENNILLYEEAWNPITTILHGLFHLKGREGLPSTLKDWVLFPDPKKCKEIETILSRRVPRIDHTFSPTSTLVEIGPKLERDADKINQYLAWQPDPVELVLDTRHIRESDAQEFFGSNPEEWKKTIRNLSDHITTVHVQPVEDMDEFVNGNFRKTITYELIKELQDCLGSKTEDLIYVAEFKPRLAEGNLETAQRFLEIMKSF